MRNRSPGRDEPTLRHIVCFVSHARPVPPGLDPTIPLTQRWKRWANRARPSGPGRLNDLGPSIFRDQPSIFEIEDSNMVVAALVVQLKTKVCPAESRPVKNRLDDPDFIDAREIGKGGPPVLDLSQHALGKQVHVLPFKEEDTFVGICVYQLRDFLRQRFLDHLAQVDIDLLSSDVQSAVFGGGPRFSDVTLTVSVISNEGSPEIPVTGHTCSAIPSAKISRFDLTHSWTDLAMACLAGCGLFRRAPTGTNISSQQPGTAKDVSFSISRNAGAKDAKSSLSPVNGSIIVCSMASVLPSGFLVAS